MALVVANLNRVNSPAGGLFLNSGTAVTSLAISKSKNKVMELLAYHVTIKFRLK